MGIRVPKQLLLLLFLITLVSSSQKARVVEARSLSLVPQQSKNNYHKNQLLLSLNFLLVFADHHIYEVKAYN